MQSGTELSSRVDDPLVSGGLLGILALVLELFVGPVDTTTLGLLPFGGGAVRPARAVRPRTDYSSFET